MVRAGATLAVSYLAWVPDAVATVFAQPENGPERLGDAALDASYFNGTIAEGPRTTVAESVIGARIRANAMFWFAVELPSALYVEHVAIERGRFTPANPLVGAHAQGQTRGFQWDLGFGGTVPLLAHDLFYEPADFYAAAIRGFQDQWLWRSDALALLLPARIHKQIGHGFAASAELAPAVLVGVRSRAREYDAVALVAGEAEYSAWLAVKVAMRVQCAWLPDGTAQASVEPHATLVWGRAFFHGRFTLNLDDPAGLTSQAPIWGLHAGAGVGF
jgi:hypothetical protein